MDDRTSQRFSRRAPGGMHGDTSQRTHRALGWGSWASRPRSQAGPNVRIFTSTHSARRDHGIGEVARRKPGSSSTAPRRSERNVGLVDCANRGGMLGDVRGFADCFSPYVFCLASVYREPSAMLFHNICSGCLAYY